MYIREKHFNPSAQIDSPGPTWSRTFPAVPPAQLWYIRAGLDLLRGLPSFLLLPTLGCPHYLQPHVLHCCLIIQIHFKNHRNPRVFATQTQWKKERWKELDRLSVWVAKLRNDSMHAHGMYQLSSLPKEECRSPQHVPDTEIHHISPHTHIFKGFMF